MAPKIGLLGGTFDPIHFGHLRAAEEAYESLGLEKVLFIPTAYPPHKSRPDLSPFALRFEMVKRALRGLRHFEASDLEEKLPKPSYSVRTLAALRDDFPNGEFFFILGLDAFLELETWYHYEKLPSLAHLVVVTRGGGGKETFLAKLKSLFPEAEPIENGFKVPNGFTLRYLPIVRLDISSTYLRRCIKEGRSIRFLTPETVEAFVREKGLYLGPGASSAKGGCGKTLE